MGELEVSEDTYQTLMEIAGEAIRKSDPIGGLSEKSISEIFQMIVSSREFQMCWIFLVNGVINPACEKGKLVLPGLGPNGSQK